MKNAGSPTSGSTGCWRYTARLCRVLGASISSCIREGSPMPDTPAQALPADGPPTREADEAMPAAREVFLYFLLLGFINVGGPVAQITMMFNQMVERRHWLSQDRFVKIMGFAHMLPGPEALQLAIYVGYLKRGLLGGILAGLTFIIPGALVMIVLSWLYVTYGSLPQVNDALYILKPAVLGIIAAGIIKLGRAAIKNWVLAGLLGGTGAGG